MSQPKTKDVEEDDDKDEEETPTSKDAKQQSAALKSLNTESEKETTSIDTAKASKVEKRRKIISSSDLYHSCIRLFRISPLALQLPLKKKLKGTKFSNFIRLIY